MADRETAVGNLSRALAQLEAFAALPIETDRDRAGLVQGFEFTFELFWKYFQKVAPDAGLTANTPREALRAGVLLRCITDAESNSWTLMLRDRNLTSHTYNLPLAKEIVGRIVSEYLPCFRSAMARIRALPLGS